MQAFQLCMPLIIVHPRPAKRRSFSCAPPVFMGNTKENPFLAQKSALQSCTPRPAKRRPIRCRLIWGVYKTLLGQKGRERVDRNEYSGSRDRAQNQSGREKRKQKTPNAPMGKLNWKMSENKTGMGENTQIENMSIGRSP